MISSGTAHQQAQEILYAGARRAVNALKVTTIAQTACVKNGEVVFLVSFDMRGVLAEVKRAKIALFALQRSLSGPRVVRGDRVGRRRRRG